MVIPGERIATARNDLTGTANTCDEQGDGRGESEGQANGKSPEDGADIRVMDPARAGLGRLV